jgi:hypothetical protein
MIDVITLGMLAAFGYGIYRWVLATGDDPAALARKRKSFDAEYLTASGKARVEHSKPVAAARAVGA